MISKRAVAKPEAWSELCALANKKCGGVPVALLAEHVLRVAEGGDWPVLRAAMEAALRRFAACRKEGMKVASRPERGRPFGDYTTRRPRERPRSYRTLLRGLDPLDASCDCRDFVRNSLGLCKHVVTVLLDLATRPRSWQRALDGPDARTGLCWYPVRPLTGDGDWIEGIRLADAPNGGKAWERVRAWFGKEAPGGRRIRQTPTASQRLRLVNDLLRVRRSLDPALHALLLDEKRRLARAGSANPPLSLRGLKRKLYPYQSAGVRRFLRDGVLLLGDDMGLGKTAQATASCHALLASGKVSRGLLIVPASLKPQWLREWRLFSDAPVAVVEGSPDQRADIYEKTRRGFLIANYEQVLRDLELMRAWKPGIVVLDEAQRIKNWATKTATYVKTLNPPFKLVLTGTPMENRLDELASLMDWVDDRALEPKWRLAPWHTIFANGSKEVIGARNLDTLRRRIGHRLLRRTRKEVLGDLPARTDTVVPVEMTEDQQDAHDALRQPIAQLMRIAQSRPLTQAQFLKLMQLLTTQRIIANGLAQSGFTAVWPDLPPQGPSGAAALKALDSPKLAELREIVKQLAIEQGRKIVIFSQWRRMLQLAQWATRDIMEDAGLRAAFFTGKESARRRTNNIVDFHDDPDTRILFCTDAGGVGLNLQRAATCCINLDLPWNPAVLEQRIARIHRIGQEKPIDVYNLVSVASIEERIATLVRDKKALFDGLFEGTTDQITFAGSVSFLSQLKEIAEPVPELSIDEDAAEERRVDSVVAAADESTDPSTDPVSETPRRGVQELFAGIRVETMPDGAMRIEAPPEAAETLAGLFEAMAGMLRGSSATSDREEALSRSNRA